MAFLWAKGIWLTVVTISLVTIGPILVVIIYKWHHSDFKKHAPALILFGAGMMYFFIEEIYSYIYLYHKLTRGDESNSETEIIKMAHS